MQAMWISGIVVILVIGLTHQADTDSKAEKNTATEEKSKVNSKHLLLIAQQGAPPGAVVDPHYDPSWSLNSQECIPDRPCCKYVNCPTGTVCKIVPRVCTSTAYPCYEEAKCMPVNPVGIDPSWSVNQPDPSWPVNQPISGVCAELCPRTGCPTGQSCQSNGCGHSCQTIVALKDPLWPVNQPVSGVCAELCPWTGCPAGQSCQSNGCGHSCQTIVAVKDPWPINTDPIVPLPTTERPVFEIDLEEACKGVVCPAGQVCKVNKLTCRHLPSCRPKTSCVPSTNTGSAYGNTGSAYGNTGSAYGNTGSAYGNTFNPVRPTTLINTAQQNKYPNQFFGGSSNYNYLLPGNYIKPTTSYRPPVLPGNGYFRPNTNYNTNQASASNYNSWGQSSNNNNLLSTQQSPLNLLVPIYTKPAQNTGYNSYPNNQGNSQFSGQYTSTNQQYTSNTNKYPNGLTGTFPSQTGSLLTGLLGGAANHQSTSNQGSQHATGYGSGYGGQTQTSTGQLGSGYTGGQYGGASGSQQTTGFGSGYKGQTSTGTSGHNTQQGSGYTGSQYGGTKGTAGSATGYNGGFGGGNFGTSFTSTHQASSSNAQQSSSQESSGHTSSGTQQASTGTNFYGK